jgi:hypothetical protein
MINIKSQLQPRMISTNHKVSPTVWIVFLSSISLLAALETEKKNQLQSNL